jgi:crossover junction endodeoxyribonuclease RuvC
MIILGIDPGLSTTGFGAIQCDGTSPSILKCGCIRTSPGKHMSARLFQIHTDLNNLIQSLHPDLLAVENAFSLVRYPRAGILLGGVLGIIYLSVFQNGISMIEITPREVKNSLAGYGAADKRQMKATIRKLLGISGIKSLHASDALAVALTAFYRKIPKAPR